MPAITDAPPAQVSKDILALRASLDKAIPAKQVERNILIATWNLRGFGGLTEKWASEYDQIAWFTGQNGLPALSLNYQTGGNYDFMKTAMPSRNLAPQDLSWHISDHYPLWTEFSVRG